MVSVMMHQAVSEQEGLLAATEEVLQQIQRQLVAPKLAIFVCTFNHTAADHAKAVALVQEQLGSVPVIGGSCLGFFTSTHCYDAFSNQERRRGVGLFVLDSPELEVSVGLGENVDRDPVEAGRRAVASAIESMPFALRRSYLEALETADARDFVRRHPLSAVLLSPGATDRHLFMEQDILDGIRKVTGTHMRIAGGGLSAGLNAAGTWEPTAVFFNGQVYREAVCLALLHTRRRVGFGVGNGYTAQGQGLFITQGDQWNAREINGRPAALAVTDLFQSATHVSSAELRANPLVALLGSSFNLGVSEGFESFYWPTIPAALVGDEVVFISKIKTGLGLSLIKLDQESCLRSAEDAAAQAREDCLAPSFDAALFFSCGMRGLYLERLFSEETAAIKRQLGANTALFGLVSCAEVGSYRGGIPKATGFTMSLMAIGQ